MPAFTTPLLEWACPKPKLSKSHLRETLQWLPFTCRIHVEKTMGYRASSFGLLCFCSSLLFCLPASTSSTYNHESYLEVCFLSSGIIPHTTGKQQLIPCDSTHPSPLCWTFSDSLIVFTCRVGIFPLSSVLSVFSWPAICLHGTVPWDSEQGLCLSSSPSYC